MKVSGNLRKMKAWQGSEVQYALRLFDVLEPKEEIALNQFLGETIKITFQEEINCVVSGEKISKVFGEGMSYKAFMSSPMAVESIIRPELSRIHEGIALRDEAWEIEHHLQPHYVYLSLTSGVKVGVTRTTQIPTRWIDQGAVNAIILAETPYRQAAGLIEVDLKKHFADKTAWQAMLKNEVAPIDLLLEKQRATNLFKPELKKYLSDNHEVFRFDYPVDQYPQKVKSLKLEKEKVIEKTLVGIKGQYLLFDDESVINIRSHSGYKINFEV